MFTIKVWSLPQIYLICIKLFFYLMAAWHRIYSLYMKNTYIRAQVYGHTYREEKTGKICTKTSIMLPLLDAVMINCFPTCAVFCNEHFALQSDLRNNPTCSTREPLNRAGRKLPCMLISLKSPGASQKPGVMKGKACAVYVICPSICEARSDWNMQIQLDAWEEGRNFSFRFGTHFHCFHGRSFINIVTFSLFYWGLMCVIDMD